jgi:hypothetical protein
MISKILKILLILQIPVQTIYALDPMYDYRYTFGPEIVVPDAFHVGIGGWTHYNEDLSLALNFQIGLIDEFELGLKYIGGTNQKWIIAKPGEGKEREHRFSLIDVGAKYAISPYLALQADVPMAINKNMKWSGVLSITNYSGFAKNVSFIYEGRFGFGEMPGENSYVKPSLSVTPFFQIGPYFRMSTGVVSSFSVGDREDFKRDFMLDVLPRIELGFVPFRITGEVSVGILTYDAKRYNRYALLIVSDV